MPSDGSTGDPAGWRATRAGAKTGRTSVPLRGAKPAPSCPILPYTLRDFLRFSAGVWGFKSPLSHVFFPSFPRLSPRPRHNWLWVRHNSSPKERRIECGEPLQLAPAVARHPFPVVTPEREVVDPRLGLEPRDLDPGVERRRHKRVLGRVEPAHAEPKGALRRVPVRQEGVRLDRGAPCVGKDRRSRLNTQRLERAQSRTVSGKSCTVRRAPAVFGSPYVQRWRERRTSAVPRSRSISCHCNPAASEGRIPDQNSRCR